MPTRAAAPNGAPCWVDLMTTDVDRSRDFYTQLLGWSAEDPNPEFGGYFNYTLHDVRIAGCMAAQPDMAVGNVWSIYLATDDAERTVADVAAHGGEVYVPPMAVADLGTMAVVGDAGGASVGIWQPGTHPGFGILGETGAPSWFDLLTRDYEATVAFYRDVFGWETHVVSDTPGFRYTTLVVGDAWLCGIMDVSTNLSEAVPAHWSVYFGVDDTDAALATIQALGGSTVVPAEDTPYGRLATATDATGATFKLVAPNEAMPAEERPS